MRIEENDYDSRVARQRQFSKLPVHGKQKEDSVVVAEEEEEGFGGGGGEGMMIDD